jgi:hypothetical protein
LPAALLRQWVVTFPYALRFLFATRLAALLPRPQANLTCYHGLFAPNGHQREQVTPARRWRAMWPSDLLGHRVEFR